MEIREFTQREDSKDRETKEKEVLSWSWKNPTFIAKWEEGEVANDTDLEQTDM